MVNFVSQDEYVIDMFKAISVEILFMTMKKTFLKLMLLKYKSQRCSESNNHMYHSKHIILELNNDR